MLKLRLPTTCRFLVQAAFSRAAMEIVAAVAEPCLGISWPQTSCTHSAIGDESARPAVQAIRIKLLDSSCCAETGGNKGSAQPQRQWWKESGQKLDRCHRQKLRGMCRSETLHFPLPGRQTIKTSVSSPRHGPKLPATSSKGGASCKKPSSIDQDQIHGVRQAALPVRLQQTAETNLPVEGLSHLDSPLSIQLDGQRYQACRSFH